MIADYVKETDNHVLYRVTPVYDGNNLVVSGVHMEAFLLKTTATAYALMYMYTTISPV